MPRLTPQSMKFARLAVGLENVRSPGQEVRGRVHGHHARGGTTNSKPENLIYVPYRVSPTP